MHWLQALDTALFRFVNHGLQNPVFDAVMPSFSSHPLFFPVATLAGLLLIWKGSARGAVCVLMLALIVALGDGLICLTIKNAVARQRPFLVLPDVHLLVGKSKTGSMPSSHAANWFAATMVAFIYYRRSVWFMLPIACLVSFSRMYNGVHYPSDVLAGAILGAGYAVAGVWALNTLWHWAGPKWFPLWWEKLPSLVEFRSSPLTPRPSSFSPPPSSLDSHWLRLGYLWIGALLLARLAYIAGATIELSQDESYQWLWSKHLALSYYSKPPLIAYAQFLGTLIWGDNAFGVRFFAPLISAILGFAVLRFFSRMAGPRPSFLLSLIVTAAPLMSAGAVLMTIDPLSVLFWTAAMIAGWRAVQPEARTRDWLWVGLWMGLGFLSKYTELFQWLCWAVFLVLWRPARAHLRRPGPYLALLVNGLCALPVLIWNAQHNWPTVQHLADRADLGKSWEITQARQFFFEFLIGEFGLLNPIFFVGMLWAAVAFWRRHSRDPRMLYFFSMGAPLFLFYLFFSLHSRVLPNWIAPSVLPLFCLMALYWDARWREAVTWIKGWLTAGLALGFTLVILGHNTDLLKKLAGQFLPVNQDPLHRVRGWSDVARVAGEARQELLAEGKPVFIIADHYGLVGEISFYLPEAKVAVTEIPLAYYKSTIAPANQFFFWPGYGGRKGENAIYIRELSRDDPKPKPPPAQLVTEFESVTDLGIRNVLYHGRVLRPLQFFACRNLK